MTAERAAISVREHRMNAEENVESRREGLASGDSCLDEETVLAFVRRSLSEERVAIIERHLDQCADCLELVGAAATEIGPTLPISSDETQEEKRELDARSIRFFGRYRIIEPVGYGGVGIVYRATNIDSGQTVALKTVRVQEPGAAASIRREIHALSRVRHPGVVRILEQGIEGGYPWYVMELIEGPTLEDYLEAIRRSPAQAARDGRSGTGPRSRAPTLRAALGVLQRLASTLSYLHGLGFAHRDLTPFNVLIRRNGTPVLVDFGLALESAFGGRDVLERAASVAGTVMYIAPEQILAQQVDARADLYALGCILYKAVTGRPPFTGTSVRALLQQHLTAVPVPPSELTSGVPPQLEALILRLLEKRPRARIGYAEDVAATLADILGEAPSSQPGDLPESVGPPSGVRPKPYVYRPLFSGREDWIETFDDLLKRLNQGSGGQVYVGGESGIGKTRLVAEVAARAQRSIHRIVTGQCAAMGVDTSGNTGKTAALHPLRLLLRTIAHACRDGGRERSQRLVGARAKVLSAYEPSLLDLPGQGAYADPPELSAQATLHRILSYLKETLAAFAAEAPLLLVLDDLQWADELSLLFLESLRAEFFERSPVFIIGTYRTEEKSAAIDRLIQAPLAKSILLGRLSLLAVRAMISDMLVLDYAPAPLCELLAKDAAGNPFFITEQVRAAVEEGWLTRESDGRWSIARTGPLPLPGSLKDLIRRRLSALSPMARHVLSVASVLGLPSDSELLLAVADIEDTESLEAIKELLTYNVFEELPRGRFRFAHDKLREAAYEGILPARRRELHRRAASAIERRSVAVPGAKLLHSILAHHWVEAQVFDKAIECLEKAGDTALVTAAYGEAAAFFERALDLSRGRQRTKEELHRQARWERCLGEAHYALGDLPRCEQHSRAALADFGHPLPSSRVGWTLELFTEAFVQVGHLLRPGHAGTLTPERRSTLKEAAVTAARISHSYYFADDGLAVLASSLLAVNLIERAGVDAPVARPYAQLGYLAGVLHLRGLADAYFVRSRASAAATNDPGELAVALYTEAAYQLFDGEGAKSLVTGGRALELLTSLEKPQETEIVQTILAHADYCAGRYEASRARCAAILKSARARENLQHEAWGLYADARNLLRLGRFDDALEGLTHAQDLLRRQSDRASDIICTGLSAQVRLHRGEPDIAEHLADATMTLIGRSPPTVFSVGDGYSAAAEVYIELFRHKRSSLSLAGKVKRAWEALGRFALAFTFGRPSFLLYSGRIQAILGLSGGAARLFHRAIDKSRELGMPFEEALSQKRLGELPGLSPTSRAEHLGRAREAFERLGCTHYLG
jgi:serine/threonine protein kinase/tetratricopeptide (TPR) repeat protein